MQLFLKNILKISSEFDFFIKKVGFTTPKVQLNQFLIFLKSEIVNVDLKI
jgi:hypothetical protein